MPTIHTLGAQHVQTQFEYEGSVEQGATIIFLHAAPAHVAARFFRAALRHFAGRVVAGGFQMDAPPAGGFGEWVRDNSHELNDTGLSPRHASFVAAILVHEHKISSSLQGNAVMLHFPPNETHG